MLGHKTICLPCLHICLQHSLYCRRYSSSDLIHSSPRSLCRFISQGDQSFFPKIFFPATAPPHSQFSPHIHSFHPTSRKFFRFRLPFFDKMTDLYLVSLFVLRACCSCLYNKYSGVKYIPTYVYREYLMCVSFNILPSITCAAVSMDILCLLTLLHISYRLNKFMKLILLIQIIIVFLLLCFMVGITTYEFVIGFLRIDFYRCLSIIYVCSGKSWYVNTMFRLKPVTAL